MSRGLLDASVFIATESGRPIGALPDEGAISVITIGELELGMLAEVIAATAVQHGLPLYTRTRTSV